MEKCEFTPGEDLTSTGMLTVPGGIDPRVHGALVHQACFNKRMGQVLPLGRLEARYCCNFVFAWEGSPFPLDQHLSQQGCKYYYCP